MDFDNELLGSTNIDDTDIQGPVQEDTQTNHTVSDNENDSFEGLTTRRKDIDPIKKWGSIGQTLNDMFRQGDKIEVYAGANKIDNLGSFIAATDNYLIWSNHNGDIVFQHIGGTISIRKVGNKNRKKKHKKTNKSNLSPHKFKSESNNDIKGEILKEVEAIKHNVQSTLKEENASPNKRKDL